MVLVICLVVICIGGLIMRYGDHSHSTNIDS